MSIDKLVTSFGNGLGSSVASVGTLIALGAMLGKLLADSGGADQIVDTIVRRSGPRLLPWAMAWPDDAQADTVAKFGPSGP